MKNCPAEWGRIDCRRRLYPWKTLNAICAACFITVCCAMPVYLQAQSWTNTTLSASQRASLLLAQMTFSEKAAMVYGTAGPTGSNYVGNIANNTRLGIPWLFLQDGPAGVADGANNVTAFPAPIALAASWDVSLARQYGVMLGSEERGKGVGVVLGPMMNMARVYEDGRAFEGCDEDPFLSAAMAAAEIPGIQSQGIVATAKHFVCNDQETDRTTISADVDPRTLHEIYEAPFRASVRAGVGAVMASYNLVNNVHACQLPALNTDLKKAYGFNGWIMSDWGATFDTVDGMNNGLDMDMYEGQFTSSDITAAIQVGSVPASELNGMVQRILTSMFQFGLFDNPPTGNLNSSVTNSTHQQFALNEAEEGIVLLQNNGGLLPLSSSVQSIAVIGSAASTSPISTGAGSAGVNLPYNVTPLTGITSRAGGGVTVNYAQGDGASTAAAVSLAQTSQVAIVCVGQQTSEGSDRTSLLLPNNEDALISAVAAVNTNTIVVMYESSATLMPWASQVAGIVMAWYPGQENGNALAHVLFGDVNPSGKLPITFPMSDADLPHPAIPGGRGPRPASEGASAAPVAAPAPAPGGGRAAPRDFDADYMVEGLNVGYKWFDSQNKTPLFPFGHGLSYTTFAYSGLKASTDSVSFVVRNTGRRAGAEVAQVYVGLPTAAKEPPKRLVAWEKVQLNPGEAKTVTLKLEQKFLSIFNEQKDDWEFLPGEYKFFVGGSSRNTPLTATASH